MRSTILVFILLLLTSCAKKGPEEVLEAVDVAQSYLSSSKCDEAIKVLEEVGRQNDDPVYVQVLASAYACKSGFNEINFIAHDVGSIDTSPSTDLMKSLSLLSLSNESTSDSSAYASIRTALGILLEAAGGTRPSQLTRQNAYGVRKAGDMGVQILILSVVQLGKFLDNFGNVDGNGGKGLGSNTNTCFLNYTYANAQTVVAALPAANNCNSNTAGHADLDLTTAAGKRRACEGLMLVTNLIDVLNNIDLSGSSSLSNLTSVATVANSFKTTAVAADPALATLLDTTSQATCEATLASASEVNNMQFIYSLIFETGLP